MRENKPKIKYIISLLKLGFLTLFILIIYSCESGLKTPSEVAVFNLKNFDSDTLRNHHAKLDSAKDFLDSLEVEPILEHSKVSKIEKIEFTRYEEFPGDIHINGKPLTIQMEISENDFNLFSDTLLILVKQRYQMWEGCFPVSIADNFEEGISTEHIYYPELIVNFELFEEPYSAIPYLIVPVKVYRDRDGVTHSNFVN